MAHNNEQRTDKLLHKVLRSKPVTLDFEAWKAAHPEQVAIFRRQKRSAAVLRVVQSRLMHVALAACLILAAGLVLQLMQLPQRPSGTVDPGPAAMMSRLHLTLAYAEGGMEGLEGQYEKAYAKLGPRAGVVSVNNLFSQF